MKFRRFSAFFLALLLAALCALPVGAVAEGCTQETNVTTILFTHDLHSHFLPQPTAEGGESGGYARLKTVIDGERAMNPDALLVDGGDFSIGSLIQTLYTLLFWRPIMPLPMTTQTGRSSGPLWRTTA